MVTVVDPDRSDGRYAAFTGPATAGLIVEGVDANGVRVADWDNSDLYNLPSP